jgi:hypothetical protein
MTYAVNGSYTLLHTIAADVADDATFTTVYPTGSTQATFTAGNYVAGSARIVVSTQNTWADADPGIEVTTLGTSTITWTNRTGATLAAGTSCIVGLRVWPGTNVMQISLPVSLDTVTAADVVTSFRPGVFGYVTNMQWVTDVAPSASDAATFNLEIGTTDVTGGVIVLTSAVAAAKGEVVQCTRITAGHRLTPASLLSIEAADVTDYATGSGQLVITIQVDQS